MNIWKILLAEFLASVSISIPGKPTDSHQFVILKTIVDNVLMHLPWGEIPNYWKEWLHILTVLPFNPIVLQTWCCGRYYLEQNVMCWIHCSAVCLYFILLLMDVFELLPWISNVINRWSFVIFSTTFQTVDPFILWNTSRNVWIHVQVNIFYWMKQDNICSQDWSTCYHLKH